MLINITFDFQYIFAFNLNNEYIKTKGNLSYILTYSNDTTLKVSSFISLFHSS